MTDAVPFISTGEATAILPARQANQTPITVIGTEAIRNTFDAMCVTQALNARGAPGVTDLVLNPDAHCGYGAPIGCVLVSPTHVYPGPVGVDIKCSMSLLQLDVPADAINDVRTRRALIEAIVARTPTGAGKGQRSVRKSRHVDATVGKMAATQGASAEVCAALGIPECWAQHCEDAFHLGHNDTRDALEDRLEKLLDRSAMGNNFADKVGQLGSYGGGNHFGECEVVQIARNDRARSVAETFGLKDNHVAFLSHSGSRGFGYQLASGQFRALQEHFKTWDIPLPGGDRELVYAPLGTPEADAYIDDMSLGANFATVNHMLINALVLDAFQEVLPGTTGSLVYFISHNIARRELVRTEVKGLRTEPDGTTQSSALSTQSSYAWVHRKGATRAFPAGHPGLKGTPFAQTGHPILLPGNPQAGSVVMVADSGAAKSCYSVNHGAGRQMGRKAAIRALDQKTVDQSFADSDILTNCRQYPKDEAPAAYKDFNEVLRSVTTAGLASEVARLTARFVIKDADKADD
jgi:tRNA-splicing ligase RtcB (3'-phosphate/5'-hydroxy nucleic acid ligase)